VSSGLVRLAGAPRQRAPCTAPGGPKYGLEMTAADATIRTNTSMDRITCARIDTGASGLHRVRAKPSTSSSPLHAR